MATQTLNMTDAPESPEAPKPAASKKIPTIAVLALAVVLSIVMSVVIGKMLFGKPAAAAKPAKAEVGSTMALDEFLINLADVNQDRYVKTSIALGLKKGVTEDDLKDQVPQIRDCIVTVLSTQTLESVRTEQGKLKLKKELVAKINKAIADDHSNDKVVEIYFQTFATQ
jgi:flagellar FliL protein